MEKLDAVIFYSLERAIKVYRQFAQRNISRLNFDITIDQWLILKSIQDNSDISQKQIAVNVFKDMASVTRILELLVNKKYLVRKFHSTDRRRFDLTITKQGLKILTDLTAIIESNRAQALKSISKKDIKLVQITLAKITDNCK